AYREIVALVHQRNERQSALGGGGAEPETRIRSTRCDGRGDRGMREFLLKVAVQCLGSQPLFGHDAVDQQTRPRSRLAIDEAQALLGDVLEIVYARRIAARQDQSLLSVDKADQSVAPHVEPMPKWRDVACPERDVKAGRVSAALGELLQCV